MDFTMTLTLIVFFYYTILCALVLKNNTKPLKNTTLRKTLFFSWIRKFPRMNSYTTSAIIINVPVTCMYIVDVAIGKGTWDLFTVLVMYFVMMCVYIEIIRRISMMLGLHLPLDEKSDEKSN